MGQKDILDKLNEIALETNWGTVERVNGVPQSIAVIKEAWACIRDLRAENAVIQKQFDELVVNTNNALKRQPQEIISLIDSVPTNDCNELNHLYLLKKSIAKRYGVGIEKNE